MCQCWWVHTIFGVSYIWYWLVCLSGEKVFHETSLSQHVRTHAYCTRDVFIWLFHKIIFRVWEAIGNELHFLNYKCSSWCQTEWRISWLKDVKNYDQLTAFRQFTVVCRDPNHLIFNLNLILKPVMLFLFSCLNFKYGTLKIFMLV